MRVGIDVAQHQLTWDEILERVRFAEEAGFDGAWVFDHFTSLYGDPEGPCLEGWSLLAGLAAATSRIRLGALVTGITHRHPAVLATQAVTVDHISAGRLELGLGAAWFIDEHKRFGISFPPPGERIRMLAEAIRATKLLMTQDGVTLEGRHVNLSDATYRPRPVQRPHPPIWIGASGERSMLPLVAREADAWHAFGDPDRLKKKSELIDRHAAEAGRDPASILRSTSLSLSEPWDEVRRSAAALREAGFAYLVASWPSEGRPRVEEFVERVMPELVAE